jgi:transcriptional regulator with XRE-family HTH domain
MKFGEYLSLLRMEKEMSLRSLSKATDIDVAYLSRIERSVESAPHKTSIIDKLASAFKLSAEQKQKLIDLASVENGSFPPDLKEEFKEYTAIPILLRTINNKRLSNEKIRELTERIQKEY